MKFLDKVKEDYKIAVVNTDEFGEEVTYLSEGVTELLGDIQDNYILDIDDNYIQVGGSDSIEKVIKAMITRRGLVPNEQNVSRIVSREIEILISTDPDEGIATIKKGRDKVRVALYTGQPAVEFFVASVLEKDEAMARLLLMR
jgi:hypothetical protein